MVSPIASPTVRKYLDRHAEPEAQAALEQDRTNQKFGHAIVIPSLGEGERIRAALHSIPQSPTGPRLVIVVVNARATGTPAHHLANSETLRLLCGPQQPAFATVPPESVLANATPEDRLLIVDRATPGRFLPEKQGVGLARKIGADIALAYWARGHLISDWICSSDADAELPTDYFARLPDLQAARGTIPSAALFPFCHRAEDSPRARDAIALYECFLRYQLLGLHSAGSPYAFHTVGSSIAVSAKSYAEVRGFPKRMAGEDFYFLNKLAKVGSIAPLPGVPITLAGRASDRVPFGTGRAMTELLDPDCDPDAYRFPSPAAFAVLGLWIRQLEDWIERASQQSVFSGQSRPSIEQLMKSDVGGWNLPSTLTTASATGPLTNPTLLSWLEDFGAFRGLAPVLASGGASTAHTARAVHGWFDGFRTMMFLHGLRDLGYPDLPYRTALESAEFITPHQFDGAPSPQSTLALLTELESARCSHPRSRAAGGD